MHKKGNERFKENDVILFKRNDKYILHRIVKVYEDHYSTLGDNCIHCEANIKDEEVLGILTSFQRDGKKIDINDTLYQLYIKATRLFEKPRIVSKKGIIALKRVVKSIPIIRKIRHS